MEEVVILSAVRTPIGKYKGTLAGFSAVELGAIVVKESVKRAKVSTDAVGQVLLGNVLQAGNGQNVARQAAIKAGLPYQIPATTINEVCGSGLKALIYGMQQIQLGQTDVIVAGGTESMSQAAKVSKYDYAKEEWQKPFSSLFYDGLTDAFSDELMGLTAEKVATEFNVTRQMQDQFAYESQQKAAAAAKAGYFVDEIIPITLADGSVMQADESIRPTTTLEKISTLKPAFKADGSVTAANASTINDGASAIVLASKSYALEHDLPYLAVIEGYSEVGIDPSVMGIAPISAITKLLEQSHTTIDQIDLFQINEAFASASIAVQQELQLPTNKVNLYGGAIALGHPIGATGARIVTTLLSELAQTKQTTGVVSLCIGGGLGLAMLLTRPEIGENEKKFYQKSSTERLAQLVKDKNLTAKEAAQLSRETVLPEKIANNLIENKISEVSTPLGIAQNFVINQQAVLVPMATEEPSVIAAASNGAKVIAASGGITTEVLSHEMIGQVVLRNLSDPLATENFLKQQEVSLAAAAKAAYPSIYARGGGVRSITFRSFSKEGYLSIDLSVDTKDAMGANILNSMLEGLAEQVRVLLPQVEVLFAILSNYATDSLVKATCELEVTKLHRDAKVAQQIAEKIASASDYAQLDPYRAVTHNKGIMNGIDAVVLATGNDTRAVGAAAHAYAVKEDQYRGLAKWSLDGSKLRGELVIPMALGIVGGATKVLPKAQLSLKLLAVDSATQLGEVIAAVGLAQNFAAIKALVTDGIQKGHMSLQSRSLALNAGANEQEVPLVVSRLKQAPQMNLAAAQMILRELRAN